MTDKEKILDALLNRSSHCMVTDGEGTLHSAVKAKVSDLKNLQAAVESSSKELEELRAELKAEQEVYADTNKALNHVVKELEAANARNAQMLEALKELHHEAEYQILEAMPSPHRLEEELERAYKVISANESTTQTWLDGKMAEAKQRIATLEDDVINANTEQFVNLRAIAAEDACKIFKAEKEALEKKLAEQQASLSQIILDGDYTAPEGMKRIAKAALAGNGMELIKFEVAARQQGFEEGNQAGRDEVQSNVKMWTSYSENMTSVVFTNEFFDRYICPVTKEQP